MQWGKKISNKGGRNKRKESEGREKERCKETDKARAVQANAFWYGAAMAWNEHFAKRGARDLRHACQQNFAVPV